MNTPHLKEWPLWEVFVRSKQASSTSTAAACTPPTPPRRCTWRATSHPPPGRREHLGRALGRHHRQQPGREGRALRPAADKIYRHPTFYEIPEEVGHM